jgi:hypothetical protein
MKRALCAALFVALLCVSLVRAEVQPTFGVALSYDATHIVLVKTVVAEEGKFLVVESWKGNLKKDSVLKLPVLAKEAKGEMVLFLRRNGDEWQPASRLFGWRISVVWLNGGKATAVQQPRNPGPAYVTTIPETPSRQALKDEVFFLLESQRAFEAVKSIRDLEQRVKALAVIVNGHSTRQHDAIVELGKCGSKALPVLKKFLELPVDHLQQYAVAALAEAGGETVVPELEKILDVELDYWKKTGPKLQRDWWSRSDNEASKRFTKLWALVRVYRRYPTPALRRSIIAARNFFRTNSAIDAEPGFGSISEYCEDVLKGKGE